MNIIIISLVLLLALSVSTVSASDNTDDLGIGNDTGAVQSSDVNSIDYSNDVDDTVSSSNENTDKDEVLSADSEADKLSTDEWGTAAEFKDLIKNNDVISLEKNYKTGEITINKTIIINGNNNIIKGLLTLEADCTFNNVTFSDGESSLILKVNKNGVNLIINNSKFVNFKNSAIWSYNDCKVNLTFINSELTNSVNGGGINIYGNVTISNSKFYNICSKSSGAPSISIYNGNAFINKTKFIDIYNNANSGALEVSNTNLTVVDCDFINCSARTMGGAIFIQYKSNASIVSSNFINCSSGYAGTIVVGSFGNVYMASANITDCVFINNTGKVGSAIYAYADSSANITNPTYINNTATYGGGSENFFQATHDAEVMYTAPGATGMGTSIDDPVHPQIAADKVKENGTLYLKSGIYPRDDTLLFGQTPMRIVGLGNVTYTLAGLSENFELHNVTLKIGEVGVGVSLRDNVKLVNCNLTNYNGFNNIIIRGDNVCVINCNFNNNNLIYGGLFRNSGSNFTVVNCNFINNTCPDYIISSPEPVIIRDSVFADNIVTNSKITHSINITDNCVNITFDNKNKFLNAVDAPDTGNVFVNVTYWEDNEFKNTDVDGYNTNYTVTVEFYNINTGEVYRKETLTTTPAQKTVSIKNIVLDDYMVTAAHSVGEKRSITDTFLYSLSNKQVSQLTINYNNITTSDDLFIIASLDSAVTGNVTFTVGNETYTRNVSNGQAVLVLKKHFPMGEYNLTVRYNGDDTYISIVKKAILDVRTPTSPVIDVCVNEEISVDSSVVLNASVNYNVDDDFYFIILKDNVEIARILATENSGIYSAEYLFTSKGNYQISASYGDIKDLVVNNGTVTVSIPCAIDINVSDVGWGSDVILNITVPADATGIIVLEINNNITNITLPTDHGANILYNAGKLPINDYTVFALYEGDNNYGPAAAYASFKVDKIQTLISINAPASVVVETPLTLSFTTNSNSTYTLKINGEVITGNASYVPLKEGAYVITVELDENAWFNDGFNMTTFTVNPKPVPVDPKMNLTYNANPNLGDNITVFVTLPSDVNGTVTLLINNKTNATFNVVNGKANINVKGVSDKNTYAVYYAGNDEYLETTKALDLNVVLPTAITAPAVTCIYNDDAYLVITLKDVYGNALKNTVISVNLNGARNLTTDANGQAKVSLLNMAPNTYNAVINFAGTSKYLKTNATAKVIINKATPKLTAKNKKFKKKLKTKKYSVTLKTNKNKALAKVKVTLKIKKKTYKATTNAKGKATFKIKKLTKKGKYKSTVTFAGNAYYNKVSKKVTITVK